MDGLPVAGCRKPAKPVRFVAAAVLLEHSPEACSPRRPPAARSRGLCRHDRRPRCGKVGRPQTTHFRRMHSSVRASVVAHVLPSALVITAGVFRQGRRHRGDPARRRDQEASAPRQVQESSRLTSSGPSDLSVSGVAVSSRTWTGRLIVYGVVARRARPGPCVECELRTGARRAGVGKWSGRTPRLCSGPPRWSGKVVGATGFEPATSRSQSERSTRLSHAPTEQAWYPTRRPRGYEERRDC